MMEIVHPTLLLDTVKCKKNIKGMSEKAKAKGLAFRPHFKTHQSKIIGEWFKEEGVEGITVSSIKMAEYFAGAGWKDITIAFPANINATGQLDSLAESTSLTLLLDNVTTARHLEEKLKHKVNILVELDAGSRRTGIPVEDEEAVRSLVNELTKYNILQWKGFYSHFGHTYGCKGKEEIQAVFSSSLDRINSLITNLGLEGCDLHIGDTPGCSVCEEFPGVTAITPGNFVFYDFMQYKIGSCSLDELAVVMACPVVSKRRERNEIVVHGGAVHFSKDAVFVGGKPVYGTGVRLNDDGIGEQLSFYIKAFSQEHGVLFIEEDKIFEEINIGDFLGILPIHSCLTAEAMSVYQDFAGNSIDHL